MSRLLRRVLAATLLGVAAGPASLSAPAQAAACSGSQGVTVVVGSSVGCDSDGGGRAASNFTDAGHRLTYASRAPGFVCRVDGAPASDPCVEASPSDAYWALFYSDGKSGWAYASVGASSLKVPQGGSVAFVFQTSSSRTWPSVQPAVAPAPTRETTRPTSGTSKPGAKDKPRPKGSTERTTATAAPKAAVPGASATPSAGTSPATSGPTPSATPSSSATPTTEAPTTSGGDEPVAGAPAVQPTAAEAGSDSTSPAALVAGAGVVVLLAAAGGVTWYRRRSG
ncbi:hypothetical protein H1W00_04820 [Aeromicrobium sp. Marseille-Q0843]|uniref:Gram-positive cocci surface proteins LPxTG domain-containing protein n=1 Tax=Aeromicrobium phoceense TaxID=2754045 RepID=A0A838XLI2_9ACTN|nr:hypothetical protein [Aeromicrobium phoceense]MBA4607794.1 hypothetical protein [Aeromicrobium phoceense]